MCIVTEKREGMWCARRTRVFDTARLTTNTEHVFPRLSLVKHHTDKPSCLLYGHDIPGCACVVIFTLKKVVGVMGSSRWLGWASDGVAYAGLRWSRLVGE